MLRQATHAHLTQKDCFHEAGRIPSEVEMSKEMRLEMTGGGAASQISEF